MKKWCTLAQNTEAKKHTTNRPKTRTTCTSVQLKCSMLTVSTVVPKILKIIFSKFCEMNSRNIITAAASVNHYLSYIHGYHEVYKSLFQKLLVSNIQHLLKATVDV